MEQMQHPINCAYAQGDNRLLQLEMMNAFHQVGQRVTAITPAGAALGILTGTELTKVKVGVGEYNQMIDRRIAQIK